MGVETSYALIPAATPTMTDDIDFIFSLPALYVANDLLTK